MSTTAPAPAKPIRRIAKKQKCRRTTLAKVGHTDARWFVVDAAEKTLGRPRLFGGGAVDGQAQADYTPHVDTGDFIIVVNTAKLKVSGRKLEQREYDYYTYYPGGHGKAALKDLLARKPNTVFELAVRRMLPKNKLGEQMLRKLNCYKDDKHPHAPSGLRKLEL